MCMDLEYLANVPHEIMQNPIGGRRDSIIHFKDLGEDFQVNNNEQDEERKAQRIVGIIRNGRLESCKREKIMRNHV